MSEIMSHQQWMQLTHGGYTSIRSKQLKVIDDALARNHKTKSSIERTR